MQTFIVTNIFLFVVFIFVFIFIIPLPHVLTTQLGVLRNERKKEKEQQAPPAQVKEGSCSDSDAEVSMPNLGIKRDRVC